MAKILIVAGEPALLEACARILASANHQIFRAGSGEEALALCRAERPDLVLPTTVLRDMRGLASATDPGDPASMSRSPVILISGHVSPGEQAEGLESGADGYLTKPVERRTLLAHVRALLRVTETERALRESEERRRQLVDDLMQANRRLEEYNRLKAGVANMSHELRTPLTAIIGFVQLVQMTEAGEPVPPAYATAFERILRNGRHLLALIDDVLDVAKIEAGRLKIHREPFDLGDVVRSAFRELQPLARQKGIDYRLRTPEAPPLRLQRSAARAPGGDQPALERHQVHPPGVGRGRAAALGRGDVPLRGARHRGGDRRGLDEHHLRALPAGGRLDVARGGGRGPGALDRAPGRIELLGGTIAVESRVGEGSTFTVTLPLVAPESVDSFLEEGSE